MFSRVLPVAWFGTHLSGTARKKYSGITLCQFLRSPVQAPVEKMTSAVLGAEGEGILLKGIAKFTEVGSILIGVAKKTMAAGFLHAAGAFLALGFVAQALEEQLCGFAPEPERQNARVRLHALCAIRIANESAKDSAALQRDFIRSSCWRQDKKDECQVAEAEHWCLLRFKELRQCAA
jgi:hypothetical protein